MKILLIALLAATSFAAVAKDDDAKQAPSPIETIKRNHPEGAKCSFIISREQMEALDPNENVLIRKGTRIDCTDLDDGRPQMIRV